jgi:hypothetical protein
MSCGARISAVRSGAGACSVDRRRLLERRIDRGELALEIGAGAIDDSDDGESDTGCDQTILDGSGAGIVSNETLDELDHGETLDASRESLVNKYRIAGGKISAILSGWLGRWLHAISGCSTGRGQQVSVYHIVVLPIFAPIKLRYVHHAMWKWGAS